MESFLMATRKETIPPILDAIPGSTVRPMFGEYAIYLDGKVLGFICDDTLLLKNLAPAQYPARRAGLADLAGAGLDHGGTGQRHRAVDRRYGSARPV